MSAGKASTAADALSVQVTGLSSTTTQESLEEYFSFCGSIDSATIESDADGKQKATLKFLKSSAASNAAMLNGGQLDGSTIHVTIPGAQASAAAQGTSAAIATPAGAPGAVAQEDKPRTAIIAEYLAHGYQLSDEITKRAIDIDQKHGISQKWKEYLGHIDQRLGEKYQQTQAAHSQATTSATQEKPKDEQAQQSEKEQEASKMSVPGATGSTEGPTTITQVPPVESQPTSFVAQIQQQAKQLLQDPNNPVAQAQSKASELLNRPDVKSRTDWVWSKFGEYYNKAANHPTIKGTYEKASRTVQDVHEEAKRIQAQRAGTSSATSTSAAAPSGAPQTSNIGRSSASWLLVGLLLFSSISIQGALAHGDVGENGEIEPAEIAGMAPHKKGAESYVQKHMASEHHIGAFDLGSFFSLHDLDRDGVLDRAEIEAIYGVHHSTSIKHSPSAEVHDEKADKIVAEVLRRLDSNGDGIVTKREFINAGPDGLPAFDEYGSGVLGHHYDAESEYFVHHEELYHSTPESQKDDAYTHKEDVEHFQHHEEIEREEENRERHAEGMPSIEEEERLKKAAEAKGQHYESPYEAMQHKAQAEERIFREAQRGEYYSGYAQEEAQGTQHVFRGPSGRHVVSSQPDEHGAHELEDRLPGETEEGWARRKELWEQRKGAADYFEKLQKEQAANGGHIVGAASAKGSKVTQQPGESEADFRSRLNKAKWEAEQREAYGTGAKGSAKPKDDVDRMKKGAPYKYPPLGKEKSRLKKSSYFGEF